MTYVAHKETDSTAGLVLKIVLDECGDIEAPTENDPAIKLAVLHRHYANPAPDLNSPEAIEEFAAADNGWVEFPLFMYEHGGTVYQVSRTGSNPFSCPWDSGRIGSLFVKLDEIGQQDPFTCAVQFCEYYTSWANGEIYGFVVEDANGEHLDSCWGFIGSPDSYVLEEGRSMLAHHVKQAKANKRQRAREHKRMTAEFGFSL